MEDAPVATTYFECNPRNLLTRIALPDESGNTFGYDGDSKRVWANDSEGAKRSIYRGPDMLALLPGGRPGVNHQRTRVRTLHQRRAGAESRNQR